MAYWLDKNDNRIRGGDTLRNDCNDPPELLVLEDRNGQFFLGDMETPFCTKYQFEKYWEIVGLKRRNPNDNTNTNRE